MVLISAKYSNVPLGRKTLSHVAVGKPDSRAPWVNCTRLDPVQDTDITRLHNTWRLLLWLEMVKFFNRVVRIRLVFIDS